MYIVPYNIAGNDIRRFYPCRLPIFLASASSVNPLTRKVLIKFLHGINSIILVFTQAVKGFLKAPAMAWCEAHALFVIHKTNLRFISYLNI